EEVPAGRIRGVASDLGPAKRLGVGPGGVPIDSSQVDGRVRRDCVEGRASGELLVRVEVLVPATPLDPGAGWDLGEDVPDPVRTVVGGAAVAKVDPDHREPEADEVPVGVR